MNKTYKFLIGLFSAVSVLSSCEDYKDPQFVIDKEDSYYVKANQASDITRFSATISGSYDSSTIPYDQIKSIGFEVSTSQSMADAKQYTTSQGSGTLSQKLNNLAGGTTYYYRVFVTGGYNYLYSNVASFKTDDLIAPVLDQATVSNIDETVATFTAQTVDKGGATITAAGFQYIQVSKEGATVANWDGAQTASAEVTPSLADFAIDVTPFSVDITGLTAGTIYAVRADATNSQGTGYSSVITYFKTEEIHLPVASATTVSDIAVTTAKATAKVTDMGKYQITEKGFIVSTSIINESTSVDSQDVMKFVSTGNDTEISANLSGLEESTKYYICAYIRTIDHGDVKGAVKEFSTLAPLEIKPGTDYTFEEGGGTTTFNIITDLEISYTKDANWFELSYNANTKTLTVTAGENTGSSRSGKITIKVVGSNETKDINIYQKENTKTFSVEYADKTLEFETASSTKQIKVKASKTTWTAKCDATWVTISPESGSSDGIIDVTVAENTGYKPRTAEVVISTPDRGSATVYVSQKGVVAYLRSSSTEEYSVPASGAEYSLSIESNAEWIAAAMNNTSWLKLDKTSGTGNGTVKVTVPVNDEYGKDREGAVKVSSEYTEEVLYFEFTQKSPDLIFSIDKSSLDFSTFIQTRAYVNLTTNASWTAKCDDDCRDWTRLYYEENNHGYGWSDQVEGKKSQKLQIETYTTDENITRSGKITITTSDNHVLTITVKQSPKNIFTKGDENDEKEY